MTALRKVLSQKSNRSEKISTRKKKLLCRTSYSEELTALKSAYFEEVGSQKRQLF